MLVLMGAWTAHAAAQGGADRPAVRVTAYGGASLRDGVGGLRWAEDVLSTGVRLTYPRRVGYEPWLQAERFVRPDFDCTPPLACNDSGWTALAGVTARFVGGNEPGVHPYLLAGVGWAFSEENRFAWTMGLGFAFQVIPRLAPTLEVRWEDLPGIQNVATVNLGLRVELF